MEHLEIEIKALAINHLDSLSRCFCNLFIILIINRMFVLNHLHLKSYLKQKNIIPVLTLTV